MTATDFLTLRPLRRQLFLFRRRRRLQCWLSVLQQNGVDIPAEPEIMGRLARYEDDIAIGRGARLERDITFWLAQDAEATPRIEIGENVYVGRNCYLGSYLPLRIGPATLIGAYSYLITANHRIDNPAIDIREQGYEAAPVTIGRNVWLGCHVVVLPGVEIGDNSVVGAGAVVTRSIPANEIWAGVPARKIRNR